MDYRRFFRQAMMLTITTGLLASCSKDNNVGEPEADELIEIIPGAAYTRVNNSSTTSNDGTITGPVDNSMLENLTFYFTRANDEDGWLTYTTQIYPATCIYRENSIIYGDIKFETPQYYLSNGENTKMIGWYPEGELNTNRDNPTLSILFNGQTDILLSYALTGNKNNLAINGPDNLFTFQHQLTQLQFYVKAETNVAAEQWGSINSIIFPSENDQFQCQLESNRIRFTASDNQMDNPIKSTNSQNISTEENKFGIIMIAPNEDASIIPIELVIVTELNNQQTTSTVEINQGEFLAGHAYKVTLNFLQGEITIKLTPADWEAAEGPENVDLAENQPYVISDMNYIVSRNMFGDAEGWTIREEAWTTTPTAESEASIPVILEVATENLTNNATLDHIGCPEGWRMPSKTELELIQKYKSKLTKEASSGSYIPIEGSYWSGTQNAAGATYYIDMATGESGTASEEDGETHHIRCVRDVEM